MRYLITFSCYGARLHGGKDGSVDRHHHIFGSPSLEVDPIWASRERQAMRDPPYLLDAHDRREIVLNALRNVCEHREWTLLAAHVRTTHVHTVVESEEEPEKIMNAFKSYSSRNLNLVETKEKRWTRHGSTRRLWTDEQVQSAIGYVVDEQGSPMAVYRLETVARSLTVAALKTRAELTALRAQWKRDGKTVVLTNGCYDILHPGHIRLLEAASSLGDVLILALNTDSSVQRVKGPLRPLVNQNDRARLAANLQAVDAVTFFDEDTPRELIAAVLPDILVKGADWSHFVAGREEVEAAGGRVETIPLEPGFSTTQLVSGILNR